MRFSTHNLYPQARYWKCFADTWRCVHWTSLLGCRERLMRSKGGPGNVQTRGLLRNQHRPGYRAAKICMRQASWRKQHKPVDRPLTKQSRCHMIYLWFSPGCHVILGKPLLLWTLISQSVDT